MVHVSLISVLDGTALNWCRQEELLGTDERPGILRESEVPRIDGVQCPGTTAVQNGGGGVNVEDPIETYPKFWNLKPLAEDIRRKS